MLTSTSPNARLSSQTGWFPWGTMLVANTLSNPTRWDLMRLCNTKLKPSPKRSAMTKGRTSIRFSFRRLFDKISSQKMSLITRSTFFKKVSWIQCLQPMRCRICRTFGLISTRRSMKKPKSFLRARLCLRNCQPFHSSGGTGSIVLASTATHMRTPLTGDAINDF